MDSEDLWQDWVSIDSLFQMSSINSYMELKLKQEHFEEIPTWYSLGDNMKSEVVDVVLRKVLVTVKKQYL